MINLTGKSVFVKTQEEYLSVLKMAKLQGFTWMRKNHLSPIEIPFPNILNFYDGKIVTYRDDEKTLFEASEIVKDEEKIKEAWACDSGAKALEKQISCKPEEYVPDFPYNIFSTQKCAKCGTPIIGNKISKYCSECGQKIDWGEE